jgi:hypothetical protein
VDDLGAVLLSQVRGERLVREGRRGREIRDPAPGDGLDRPRPQLDGGDGHILDLRDRLEQRSARAPRHDDEIGDQDPVGVEVAGRNLDGLRCARHEHAGVDLDRRDRGAAAVEDDDVGRALRASAAPCEHVRLHLALPRAPRRSDGSRSSAPRQRRRLEVVGGRVAPGARELEQALDVGASLATSGSGGPPRPSRRRRRPGRARAARDVPVTAVLPTRLPVPTIRERRQRERRERGRIEAEVGPTYGSPRRARGSRAGSARAARAPARPRGRHELRPELAIRLLERPTSGTP